MFLNLRKGSSVYVLDTRETPKFYVATVKEIGIPYYPQPTPGQLTPFQQQYINIVLDNNESWGVRTNMDVESKDGLTVSMTRDQILKELDPSYAKTREQDEEIKRLNKELADLKGLIKSVPTLNDIKSLLKPETPKTK